MRVAVLGAGITGVTTTYSLLERDLEVTVFDRNRYAAMETSFANGGQLSASNAEVWNHWSTVAKGIGWLLRRDAPLALNPSPSWAKYTWMAEFLANIPNYRKHTIATVELAIAAREHLMQMAASAGIEFDLERRGILHFYRERGSFEHAARTNEMLKAGGLKRVAVTPQEIRSLEPALQGDFYGGFYTESDFSGDIHKFSRGLLDSCTRRGAELRLETDVVGLRPTRDGRVCINSRPMHAGDEPAQSETFDAIVVCAGIASRQFASMLGDRVPIYPVKGYSITVQMDAASAAAAPHMSLLDDATKIVASRLGEDRFRVAGTAELNGENRDIRADRVAPLTDWVRNLFPQVSTDNVTPWAGLRPMLPSMMPRVGPGRRPGVFYNTGHGHLGWTLSGATAHAVAAAVRPHTNHQGARCAPGASTSAPI
jgi:D-amino-acid dehydrogenase